MRIHLVNPSESSFGIGVIVPRWLYVLAAATPAEYGDPLITDETIQQIREESIHPGDVVGISIHSGNVYRGLEVGRLARARGAWVVFGGIHAGLYPEEAWNLGHAHAVVKGDGDQIWATVLKDCANGSPQKEYNGGRVAGEDFLTARWDLLPPGTYMWGSVQTVRGCAKHCSFCSVWRTDGQKPRQRGVDSVIGEIAALRRLGYRFIALADDNFYPVSLTDIRNAERQGNFQKLAQLKAVREERFALMERMAQLPADLVFFTQIVMEAAEDPDFLDAMRKARIKGALVGIESVTKEGLKAVFKDFNEFGDGLVERLQLFRKHGVHVLGSFIFGLPTDAPETFEATAALAERAGIAFAQFVMMTPFPGTVDFERWEKTEETRNARPVDGVPITRYWLLPKEKRPKMFAPHPTMSSEELRARTQGVWDRFYRLSAVWKRSACTPTLRSRLAFVFISKLYRQMYANTGISTDSARMRSANRWSRWLAKPTRKLFAGKPMPDLAVVVAPDRAVRGSGLVRIGD